MELSGIPGTQSTINTNLSAITPNQIKGIQCVQLITKRGEANKQEYITSWTEFKRKFGGYIDGVIDPLVAKHALDGGAILRVSRLHHYTDIGDAESYEGTKASANKNAAAIAEVLASVGLEVTAVGDDDDWHAIYVDEGTGPVLIGAYQKQSGDDETAVLNGLKTAVEGSTDYTLTGISGANATLNAPTGTGADANTYIATYGIVGGSGGNADGEFDNSGQLSGGVTAIPTQETILTALGVGSGYNGTVVTIADSQSNETGKIDITVTLPDSDKDFVVSNVKSQPNASELEIIQSLLSGVSISYTGAIINGTYTLGGGVQDVDDITSVDVNGDSSAKNGWYVFNNVTDSMRIIHMSKVNDNAVHAGLKTYVEGRKDMRGTVYIPLGYNVDTIKSFKAGTTPFSHTPLNSFWMNEYYSDAYINHPENANVVDFLITAIGKYAGRRAKVDSELGEWFSVGSEFTGILSGINDVPINFLSSGEKGQGDLLYEDGMNIIGIDGSPMVSGNRSLYKDKTSLLSKNNIADLCVYISNRFKVLLKPVQEKPNDYKFFNECYRRVRPFIVSLTKNRAIQGANGAKAGEGTWWHWFGDQFATTPDQLTFNTTDDIDSGKYKARFAFKPIASNEYILIDVAPADSVTILNIQVVSSLN